MTTDQEFEDMLVTSIIAAFQSDPQWVSGPEETARIAYEVADAVIAERLTRMRRKNLRD